MQVTRCRMQQHSRTAFSTACPLKPVSSWIGVRRRRLPPQACMRHTHPEACTCERRALIAAIAAAAALPAPTWAKGGSGDWSSPGLAVPEDPAAPRFFKTASGVKVCLKCRALSLLTMGPALAWSAHKCMRPICHTRLTRLPATLLVEAPPG